MGNTMGDYCIKSNETHSDMSKIVEETLHLSQSAMKDIKHRKGCARLVAKVNFVHVNRETNEMDERSCHSSFIFTQEVVHVKEFYEMDERSYHITSLSSKK